MLKMVYQDWNNSLHPNFIEDPEAILDCGFGSGNWAYDLAEFDPSCTVSARVDLWGLYNADVAGDGNRYLSSHGSTRSIG
jgi:hypothetical protein